MTKQNPGILCKACSEFDYNMNRKDGISFDVYVRCEHEDDNNVEIKKQGKKDDEMDAHKDF
jgi:Zn ribbon nucleic-acid-binding protein